MEGHVVSERLHMVEVAISEIKTDIAVIKANQEHANCIQERIEKKIDELCGSLKDKAEKQETATLKDEIETKAEKTRLDLVEDRQWKFLLVLLGQLCGLLYVLFRVVVER